MEGGDRWDNKERESPSLTNMSISLSFPLSLATAPATCHSRKWRGDMKKHVPHTTRHKQAVEKNNVLLVGPSDVGIHRLLN